MAPVATTSNARTTPTTTSTEAATAAPTLPATAVSGAGIARAFSETSGSTPTLRLPAGVTDAHINRGGEVVAIIPLTPDQARGNLRIGYTGVDQRNGSSFSANYMEGVASTLGNTNQIHSENRYTIDKINRDGNTCLEVRIAAPVQELNLYINGKRITLDQAEMRESIETRKQQEAAAAREAQKQAETARAAQERAALEQAAQATQAQEQAQRQQELKRAQDVGRVLGRLEGALGDVVLDSRQDNLGQETSDPKNIVAVTRTDSEQALANAREINGLLNNQGISGADVVVLNNEVVFDADAIANYGVDAFFTKFRNIAPDVQRILRAAPSAAPAPGGAGPATPTTTETPPSVTSSAENPTPAAPPAATPLAPLNSAIVGGATIAAGSSREIDIQPGETVFLKTLTGENIATVAKTAEGAIELPPSASPSDLGLIETAGRVYLSVPSNSSGSLVVEKFRAEDGRAITSTITLGIQPATPEAPTTAPPATPGPVMSNSANLDKLRSLVESGDMALPPKTQVGAIAASAGLNLERNPVTGITDPAGLQRIEGGEVRGYTFVRGFGQNNSPQALHVVKTEAAGPLERAALTAYEANTNTDNSVAFNTATRLTTPIEVNNWPYDRCEVRSDGSVLLYPQYEGHLIVIRPIKDNEAVRWESVTVEKQANGSVTRMTDPYMVAADELRQALAPVRTLVGSPVISGAPVVSTETRYYSVLDYKDKDRAIEILKKTAHDKNKLLDAFNNEQEMMALLGGIENEAARREVVRAFIGEDAYELLSDFRSEYTWGWSSYDVAANAIRAKEQEGTFMARARIGWGALYERETGVALYEALNKQID